MQVRSENWVAAMIVTLPLLGMSMSESRADTGPQFGPAVDSACQAFNGTTPYADQSCNLCHNGGFSNRVEPQWTWWRNGDLTNFCPEPPPNQAPQGTINSPGGNQTITAGQSITFTGTGSDSDGNTPLQYNWNFGGGATNSTSEDPGSVTFNNVGTFTVTFTVTDSLGLSDPTPDTRRITVNEPPPNPNQAPQGQIDNPVVDQTITVGESIVFAGTGSDPDNNTPLQYNWDFGGGAPNSSSQDPGSVTFNSVGTFAVTFTVTDSLGLSDPAPDTVRITVTEPPQSCTDADGDGFAIEGGGCGPVDCNDANAAINPAAAEICIDGIDNNCNALVDAVDPDALNCPVNQQCRDSDGDGFSPDGGMCGPVDCNDQDAATSPGADEVCGDNRDNDCDGATDAADDECNGSDCIGQLIPEPNQAPDGVIDDPVGDQSITTGQSIVFAGTGSDPDGDTALSFNWDFGGGAPNASSEDPGPIVFTTAGTFMVTFTVTDSEGLSDPTPATRQVTVTEPEPEPELNITQAEWNAGERELDVEGNQAPTGAQVTVRNAGTGEVLGTEIVEGNGEWEFELDGLASNRVPCRIRAEIGNQFGLRDVANAPADCRGGTEPPPDPEPNQAPNGVINDPAGDQAITAGEAIVFAGTGSDPDGDTPLRFSWNFGGGATNSSSEDPGSVVFANAGTFTVTFTVTDSEGLSDPTPATRQITVNDPEPELNITQASWNASERELDVEGNQAPAGARVTLWNADNSQLLATETVDSLGEWEFELNGLSDSQVPCRVRVELGSQSGVRAVANAPANCGGGTEPPPDPEPEPNRAPNGIIDSPTGDRSITAGESVFFAGTGSDPDRDSLRYNWDFGGGATDTTSEDPGSVVFATAGTYTVTFTVTDSEGLRDPTPATRRITVIAPPPDVVLNITRARWDRGDLELDVRGDQAPAGDPVILRNADTGDLLATEVVEGNGEWEFELRLRRRQVPCRVQVELGNQAAVRAVERAPRNCVGNP